MIPNVWKTMAEVFPATPTRRDAPPIPPRNRCELIAAAELLQKVSRYDLEIRRWRLGAGDNTDGNRGR